MKISSRGRYALRFMIDLAQHRQVDAVTLREVSQRQEISTKYLEQIVTLLNRSGLIRSVRGNQGGYLLARDPKAYTAGDILRAVEGELLPVACLENNPNLCRRHDACNTLRFWEGLYHVVNQYVDGITLQEMADQCDAKTEWSYSI
ncbi:MAG: Rrf2 family transcriptional regulator [Clostridiales bacterium]|nr:Rrf2 family transcriptional regulator [Clostridiales bacterium]